MYQLKLILTDDMFDLTNTVEKRFTDRDNLTNTIKYLANIMLRIWGDLDNFGFPKDFDIDISDYNVTNSYSEICTLYNPNGSYELSVRIKKV